MLKKHQHKSANVYFNYVIFWDKSFKKLKNKINWKGSLGTSPLNVELPNW
jgi:hypothetical protein